MMVTSLYICVHYSTSNSDVSTKKIFSGAVKRKQREQKLRWVRIRGRTSFELGVIRIENQELNTGGIRDIEGFHPHFLPR